VVDTLELVMGNSSKDMQAKDTIRSCWSGDPVHANLHTYFKLAGNFIDYHSRLKTDRKPSSRSKRARADSETEPQNSKRRQEGPGPAAKKKNHQGSGYQPREEHRGQGSYRSIRESNSGTGQIQNPDPLL
jgi:hypothetical protein